MNGLGQRGDTKGVPRSSLARRKRKNHQRDNPPRQPDLLAPFRSSSPAPTERSPKAATRLGPSSLPSHHSMLRHCRLRQLRSLCLQSRVDVFGTSKKANARAPLVNAWTLIWCSRVGIAELCCRRSRDRDCSRPLHGSGRAVLGSPASGSCLK